MGNHDQQRKERLAGLEFHDLRKMVSLNVQMSVQKHGVLTSRMSSDVKRACVLVWAAIKKTQTCANSKRGYPQIHFAVMRWVADHFVGRRLDSFGW